MSEPRFGDWLRGHRQAVGLSLRELARRLGVSAPYLSDVERGRRGALAEKHWPTLAVALRMKHEHVAQAASAERCPTCGGPRFR